MCDTCDPGHICSVLEPFMDGGTATPVEKKGSIKTIATMDVNDTMVAALCGKAQASQLLCPECKRSAVRARKYSESYEWAVLLYCSCSTQWVICSQCELFRTQMRKSQQISFHGWSKHKIKDGSPTSKKRKSNKGDIPEETMAKEDVEEDTVESDEVFFDATTAMDMRNENSNSSWFMEDGLDGQDPCVTDCKTQDDNEDIQDIVTKFPGKMSSSTFTSGFAGSQNSARYFWEEHNASSGGVRSIVARCQFGMSSCASSLSLHDVKFVTEMARFCHSLSRGQREQFAEILRMTAEKTTRDKQTKEKDRPWKVSIPQSYLDIRQNITNYDDAFLNILPTPQVKSIGSNFAYVGLREVVQNFLAFGYELPGYSKNHTGKVSKIVDCKHCRTRYDAIKKMYSGEVLVLWMMEWSDGYDPHAFSKANRGSAWTKVITFVPPHEKNNAIEYTYPIALGLSSGDHEVVETEFKNDLLELSDPNCTTNMFYYGKVKEFVRVHVELLVSLMDQPERRSATFLARGNSNLGARWGYSVSLNDVQHTLVPCTVCTAKQITGDVEWDKRACPSCTQWKLETNSIKLGWKRPDDFPKNEFRENGGVLLPMRLTFDVLRKAIKETETNVTNGNWNKKEAEEYLSYFCVQKKLLDEVIRRSENIRVLEIATKNQETNEQEYADVMEMVLEDEDSFSPVKIPALWSRGVSLHQHIDVMMHLVFLGAVDGTIKFIHAWLKLQNKYSSFMRLASTRLNVIRRLNLKWCKAIPYKGNKLGGWVSENYLAFARICKWFFLILDSVGQDEEEFVEPTSNQSRWTAKDNRAWLKVRGLDTSGKAMELRMRVANLRNQEGGPPPLLQPSGGTIDDVFHLVETMFGMVRSLMVTSSGDDEVQEADRCIKLFLTRIAHFEKNINTDEKKTKWIASYTFPCLLNLPDAMAEFGPLRNYWEGGVKGEGILRFLKPEHSTIGLRSSWETMVLERAIRKKILAAIAGGTTAADWEDTDAEMREEKLQNSYEYREFFKYPTIATIYKDFMDNVPLSVVQTSCNKLGMVTRADSIILLKKVEPSRNVVLRGMQFVHLKIEQQIHGENDRMVDMTLESVQVTKVYLLLPHPNQRNFYYGVGSDWGEMNLT